MKDERLDYVLNQLRRGHWEPISRAKQLARTKRAINPASGRLAWFHRCSALHGHGCGGEFVATAVQVDHVKPVIPVDRKPTLQEVCERFCVYTDGLQVLCRVCHNKKSAEENRLRRASK